MNAGKNLKLISIFFVFLFLSFYLPTKQDYNKYLGQWSAIASGGNPWRGTGNAYGIVYNAFSLPYMLHPKLPRALFVSAYVFGCLLIYNLGLPRLGFFKSALVLLIALLNPLFFYFGLYYGSNDSFLAGCVVSGLVLYSADRFLLSALFFFHWFSFQISAVDYGTFSGLS